jgi:AcrR family transcriptional regulator
MNATERQSEVVVGEPAARAIEAAKAMLTNPDTGVTQIAHRLGVSPATLYRYLPAARSANTAGA